MPGAGTSATSPAISNVPSVSLPGRLIGVALMTDSDNTSSAAQAAYGELTLTRRDGQVSRLNE